MAGKKSNDGCAGVVGGAFIGIVVLVSMVPKQVWIALGIGAAVALLAWLVFLGFSALAEHNAAAEERNRAARAAEAAAAKRQREEAARKANQDLIEAIGEKNALLVFSARSSVHKVRASEAAQAGWLGDVDFTADIRGVTENFRKAHELRKVAKELAALDSPSAGDRRILKEARSAAESLEKTAVDRVQLIGRCAAEATSVDESLRKERADARTAEQRAELHARLSGMLYGIEAAPAAAAPNSTADAVMSRVQAYREIKNEIQRGRQAD